MPQTITVRPVNYHDKEQGQLLIQLLDDYARDPMGGGKPLSDHVHTTLLPSLQKIEGAISFIATVDSVPAGFVTAFQGFSTFACQPLLNIHDLAVLKDYRGLGVAQALLSAIESEANKRDCCKITLEVLSGNKAAMAAYQKYGFKDYELDPSAGQALFWEKSL